MSCFPCFILLQCCNVFLRASILALLLPEGFPNLTGFRLFSLSCSGVKGMLGLSSPLSSLPRSNKRTILNRIRLTPDIALRWASCGLSAPGALAAQASEACLSPELLVWLWRWECLPFGPSPNRALPCLNFSYRVKCGSKTAAAWPGLCLCHSLCSCPVKSKDRTVCDVFMQLKLPVGVGRNGPVTLGADRWDLIP